MLEQHHIKNTFGFVAELRTEIDLNLSSRQRERYNKKIQTFDLLLSMFFDDGRIHIDDTIWNHNTVAARVQVEFKFNKVIFGEKKAF